VVSSLKSLFVFNMNYDNGTFAQPRSAWTCDKVRKVVVANLVPPSECSLNKPSVSQVMDANKFSSWADEVEEDMKSKVVAASQLTLQELYEAIGYKLDRINKQAPFIVEETMKLEFEAVCPVPEFNPRNYVTKPSLLRKQWYDQIYSWLRMKYPRDVRSARKSRFQYLVATSVKFQTTISFSAVQKSCARHRKWIEKRSADNAVLASSKSEKRWERGTRVDRHIDDQVTTVIRDGRICQEYEELAALCDDDPQMEEMYEYCVAETTARKKFRRNLRGPAPPQDHESGFDAGEGQSGLGQWIPDVPAANEAVHRARDAIPRMERAADDISTTAREATGLLQNIQMFLSKLPHLGTKMALDVGFSVDVAVLTVDLLKALANDDRWAYPTICVRILRLAGLSAKVWNGFLEWITIRAAPNQGEQEQQGVDIGYGEAAGDKSATQILTALVGTLGLAANCTDKQIQRVNALMLFYERTKKATDDVQDLSMQLLFKLPDCVRAWICYLSPESWFYIETIPGTGNLALLSDYFEKMVTIDGIRWLACDKKEQDKCLTFIQKYHDVSAEFVATKQRLSTTHSSYMMRLQSCVQKCLDVIDVTCHVGRTRAVPFVLYLSGAPGVSKSSISSKIILDLTPMELRDDNNLFVRNSSCRHYDGYYNQYACYMDEFAVKEEVGDGEIDPYTEFQNLVSSAPYPLPQASEPMKGKVMFTSRLMVVSSNEAYPRPKGIKCGPIWRRRNVLCDVRVKPDYCVIDSAGNKTSRLDGIKCIRGAGGDATKCIEFAVLDPNQKALNATEEYLDYDAFMAYVVAEWNRHWQCEKSRIKTYERYRSDPPLVEAINIADVNISPRLRELYATNDDRIDQFYKDVVVWETAKKLHEAAMAEKRMRDKRGEKILDTDVGEGQMQSPDAYEPWYEAQEQPYREAPQIVQEAVTGFVLETCGVAKFQRATKGHLDPVVSLREAANQPILGPADIEARNPWSPTYEDEGPGLESEFIDEVNGVHYGERYPKESEMKFQFTAKGVFMLVRGMCNCVSFWFQVYQRGFCKTLAFHMGMEIIRQHCTGKWLMFGYMLEFASTAYSIYSMYKIISGYLGKRETEKMQGETKTEVVEMNLLCSKYAGVKAKEVPRTDLERIAELAVSIGAQKQAGLDIEAESKDYDQKRKARRAKRVQRKAQTVKAVGESLDKVADDISYMLARKSIIKVRYQDRITCGVGMDGTYVLMPRHSLTGEKGFIAEGDEFKIILNNGTVFNIVFNPEQCATLEESDVLMYDCKLQGRSFPDISQLYFTDKDLEFLEKFPGALVVPIENDANGVGFRQRTGDVKMQVKPVRYTCNSQEQYNIADGWTYDIDTYAGDCGAPLLCFSSGALRKICGMHVAGVKAKNYGVAEIVTKEVIEQMKEVICEQSGPAITGENLFDEGDGEFLAKVPFPQGNFYDHRVVKDYLRKSDKTAVRESVLHGAITAPVTGPAVLDEKDPRLEIEVPNLIAKNVEKYGKPATTWNKKFLDEIRFDMLMELAYGGAVEPRVLSNHEAVSGIRRLEYFDAINAFSSAGYPWRKLLPVGQRGKEFFLSRDPSDNRVDNVIDKRVLDAIEWRDICAKHGHRVDSVWVPSLKDERRALSKVALGKTRIFTMGPLDYTVVFRKYFLSFSAHFYTQRLRCFSAVGIDPWGPEWDRMVRRLHEVGDNIFAGDFSGWDGEVPPQIVEQVVQLINDWYVILGWPLDESFSVEYFRALYGSRPWLNRKTEFWTMVKQQCVARLVLLDENCKCQHQYGNIRYYTAKGVSSGLPITVILNTMVDTFTGRHAWLELTQTDMATYHKNVRESIYGDDNIYSVHDDYKEQFNGLTVQEHLRQRGMVYTAANKVDAMVKYGPITDFTFLKCGFEKRDGRWYSLMSMDTINELINWIRKCDDEELACEDNCNDALRFMFQYGEEKFERFRVNILNACFERGLNFHLHTYAFYKRMYDVQFDQ